MPTNLVPPASVAFLSLTHRYDDTRVLHKEAHALASAGFVVSHVAPDDGRPAPATIGGVRVVLYSKTGNSRIGRFRGLWGAVWKERADVYHCNEVESWLLGCALKLLRPHARVVFDVHEHYPSRFVEGKRYPRWARLIGGPVLRILFRLLTPWTDHLVFAKRSVAPDFPARPGKATLVFNYAPLRVRLPERPRVPDNIRALFEGAPTAVHLGGFSRERGWPQLLEALTLTHNRDIRVVALGEVVEGIDSLEAEASRLGVAKRIKIVPRVAYDDLFGYLIFANVGLMLYQPGILNHVYAFPMKLYDYMLAGLPVIAPDFAPEVTPVIESERIGWLVDTSNPGKIASALDAAAADPASAEMMGSRGQSAVRRQYNWEREAEKLVSLYQDLTARRTA